MIVYINFITICVEITQKTGVQDKHGVITVNINWYYYGTSHTHRYSPRATSNVSFQHHQQMWKNY